MDPLSDVLSLLKPQSYMARGFGLRGEIAIQWPQHTGIKCYALLQGDCWLTIEGVPETLHLTAGECFLLPRGLPFTLATDPALTPVDFYTFVEQRKAQGRDWDDGPGDRYIAGGHFTLEGEHARLLLDSLPPIVHLRSEADRAAMRWAIDRMREELLNPQPGSSLMTQQVAYMLLIQALRLHLLDASRGNPGWLSALADRQMRAALGCMHDQPGHPWTLASLAERAGMSRTVFAERFRETVGATPMEYLTRWRMVLAGNRLRSSSDSVSAVANSLGYDSDSAFSKAFRKVMGTSPKQYSKAPRSVESISPSVAQPV